MDQQIITSKAVWIKSAMNIKIPKLNKSRFSLAKRLKFWSKRVIANLINKNKDTQWITIMHNENLLE